MVQNPKLVLVVTSKKTKLSFTDWLMLLNRTKSPDDSKNGIAFVIPHPKKLGHGPTAFFVPDKRAQKAWGKNGNCIAIVIRPR
jgi:hypothetical protein